MDAGPRQPGRGEEVLDRLVLAAGLVGVALAVALGVRVHLRQLPPERGMGDVAFAAVYGSPAVLVLLARRRRPALLGTAAVLSWVLALTATPRAGFVLVCSGLVGLALFLAAPDPPAGSRATLPVVATAVLVVEIMAAVVLFARVDERCWAVRQVAGEDRHYVPLPAARCRDRGVRRVDDVTTAAEGAGSLCLTAAALAAGWWLAAPRPVSGGR